MIQFSNFKVLNSSALSKIKGGEGTPTVCTTPAPGGNVPTPYPSGGGTSGSTSGSGTTGGVASSTTSGSSTFQSGSFTVVCEGRAVVR